MSKTTKEKMFLLKFKITRIRLESDKPQIRNYAPNMIQKRK